jgi:RNA recognition motif-containing protein
MCESNEKITLENPETQEETCSRATSISDEANSNEATSDEAASRTEKNRLFDRTSTVSVKKLPSKIESFSLYSRLEVIAHRISRDSLSEKNLTSLLSPYFKNRKVAATILEDLKSIALKRCSSKGKKKDSVQKSLTKALDIAMKGRFEAFSVSKYCYNMTDFLDKLENEKKISLNLDHGVLCKICHDKSATTGKAQGKKSGSEQTKCIFQGFDIDLSSNTNTDFVSDRIFHKDHLIHCYIVGLSAKKSPSSYVSIMQMTVPEVLKEIKDKVKGVKTVAVFSKTSPAKLGLLHDILV